ncbi:unnamed protein product [Blepharisma stoltei]|uniref:Uncharacterized protein n=1 Tax=Blepharisma stoltei TaxID=1481888 RepID=A0AAU9KB26_9CILI|nr:unnamed protein product [Blepharisma stoltei]
MAYEICSALELPAYPQLSLENEGEFIVLPVDRAAMEIAGNNPPIKLAKQMSELNEFLQSVENVDYMTLVHDGRSLTQDHPLEVALRLMVQPYIFSELESGRKCEADVNIGIYVPNSYISERGIWDCEYLNPHNVFEKQAHYVLESDKKCFSPVLLKFSTCIPIHVFYSLIIYHSAEIRKFAIAKHVLLIDDKNDLSQIAERVAISEDSASKQNAMDSCHWVFDRFSPDTRKPFESDLLTRLFAEIINDGNRSEVIRDFWLNIFYYLVWDQSGKPQGDFNFGEHQYLQLAENSLNQVEYDHKSRINWATAAVASFVKRLHRELTSWIGEF